jgi:hypothetical protein
MTYPDSPGKPGLGSAHGVEGGGKLPRTMQMQWNTDSGVVVFQFPSNLSADDIADLEALLAVTFQGMRRRATRSLPTGGDDAD